MMANTRTHSVDREMGSRDDMGCVAAFAGLCQGVCLSTRLS